MLIILYVIQWVLNVCWNPVFFYFHNGLFGLILIGLLTLTIGYILLEYRDEMKYLTALILPYFIWLLVATSLNGYILVKN